jgi:hypothetical protein
LYILILLLFQQVPQVQIHFFLATATDKTNNPTYCYTFTPTGVAEETSYADYVGADKETRDFIYSVFLNIQLQEHIQILMLLHCNWVSMIFQNNTYGLICKDSFQNSLVKLQLHFLCTGWNNAIGSF